MLPEGELSWEELQRLTDESVDPGSSGSVTGSDPNVWLTDGELRSRIKEWNSQGKPTGQLRTVYKHRLEERGLL